MTGSTGSPVHGLSFTDPLRHLSSDERLRMGETGLFRRLDALWEKGELPQRFTRTR
ncbi:hypothetical protein [Dactylosporangium sp. NPDC051484]|uniref:hypothetical protein n=1 Tax=Dactylosporangium sp. NPDC051484 TaxID=3154942 RepID=UPI00344FDBE1